MYLETMCFDKFNQRAFVRRRDPHLRGIDRSEVPDRVRYPWGVSNDINEKYE